MQRSIEGLRALGDPDLVRKQAEIQSEFRKRHPGVNDIPLSGKLFQATDVRNREAIRSPLSAETQKLIEQMRSDGYAVYETSGRTPASLKSDGMRYWSLDDKLVDIIAPPALLAFKKAPSEFFLPGSFNILHDEQVKLLPEEQGKVDKKYPSAGLIVREGKLPEWTELAWRHFKATKVRVLGHDYGYSQIWTDTYVGAYRAAFGRWYGAYGARADLWDPDSVFPFLRLASLVEIPRK